MPGLEVPPGFELPPTVKNCIGILAENNPLVGLYVAQDGRMVDINERSAQSLGYTI